MKYCKKCKAHVNEGLTHCPLCGAYVGEQSVDVDEVQRRLIYPSLTVESKSYDAFLKKRLFWVLVVVVAVCVAINCLTYDGKSLWSGYVLFGALVGYFVTINSVYRRRRLYSALGLAAVVACVCVFGLESIYSFEQCGSFAKVSISVEYVIPAILLATIIATDVLIACNKSKYKYYFVSLLAASLLALVPQLVIWIAKLKLKEWFTFSLFFFDLLNILVMTLVFWKMFKQEMLRKFNL